MSVDGHRVLLAWTIFCLVGGVVGSLAFGGVLAQLLQG